MKKQPVTKPVIIDYPEDRELLKREFAKIAAAPGFAESVEMSRKVIYGKNYKPRNVERKIEMTSEQIKALSESQFARTVLRVLLEDAANIERLEQLACEDIAFSRWCDRNKVWTPAKWQEV